MPHLLEQKAVVALSMPTGHDLRRVSPVRDATVPMTLHTCAAKAPRWHRRPLLVFAGGSEQAAWHTRWPRNRCTTRCEEVFVVVEPNGEVSLQLHPHGNALIIDISDLRPNFAVSGP